MPAQGFPDEEGPDEMKKRAGSALFEFNNQYPPSMGVPEARQVGQHAVSHACMHSRHSLLMGSDRGCQW